MNTKTICALACACAFTLNAKAVPLLDAEFVQDNWHYSLFLEPVFETPTQVTLFAGGPTLNESFITWSHITPFTVSLSGVIPRPGNVLPWYFLAVGDHYFGMEWIGGGQTMRAIVPYSVTAPTGPPPPRIIPVPDGGSVGFMLASGCLALIGSSRLRRWLVFR